MIRILDKKKFLTHKPQSPPKVQVHSTEEALLKTLDMMSMGFMFNHKRYDPNMERMTVDLLLKICSALSAEKVEYMIIGGTAVGYYHFVLPSHPIEGRPEIKTDLDFWYNPTYENRQRLGRGIQSLGLMDHRSKMNEFMEDFSSNYLALEETNYKMDFNPAAPGLVFQEAIKKSETTLINQVPLVFIGLDDLIKNKTEVNRLGIDDRDVSELKRINKIKEE
ncbi:MAG: hypothetical protein ACKVOQ_14985 [Cyclobacteriaceae bacterium]